MGGWGCFRLKKNRKIFFQHFFFFKIYFPRATPGPSASDIYDDFCKYKEHEMEILGNKMAKMHMDEVEANLCYCYSIHIALNSNPSDLSLQAP